MLEIFKKANIEKILQDNNFIFAFFVKNEEGFLVYYKKNTSSITKLSYVFKYIEEKFKDCKINFIDANNLNLDTLNKISNHCFYKVGELNE